MPAENSKPEMRSQAERIRTLHEEIDRIAAKYEVGHTLTLFELKINGEAKICTLSNYELGGCPGIYDMKRDGEAEGKEMPPVLRAEEMLMQAWCSVITHGFPVIPVGTDCIIRHGDVKVVENLSEEL